MSLRHLIYSQACFHIQNTGGYNVFLKKVREPSPYNNIFPVYQTTEETSLSLRPVDPKLLAPAFAKTRRGLITSNFHPPFRRFQYISFHTHQSLRLWATCALTSSYSPVTKASQQTSLLASLGLSLVPPNDLTRVIPHRGVYCGSDENIVLTRKYTLRYYPSAPCVRRQSL